MNYGVMKLYNNNNNNDNKSDILDFDSISNFLKAAKWGCKQISFPCTSRKEKLFQDDFNDFVSTVS